MKQYLIDENTLRELLRAGHILAILERDGVDNWWGWMEGREEYLTDYLGELPWNQGKTCEELNEIVEEEDYSIDNLVDDQIEAFWEEYKETITTHWTGMNGDECSNCGRSLRDLMDGDSYYSSEFENAGFDQLKACPFCGARIVKDA